MKNRLCIWIFASCVLTVTAEPLYAVCGSGRREMSVHQSDIRLDPGTRAYRVVRFSTVSLPIPATGFPTDCGLWAKSEVPGLSVVSSYAWVPPQVKPPGEWAQVGSQGETSTAVQPWFRYRSGTLEMFGVQFDGSAPAGTQGRILIAVNEGGDDNLAPRVIGSVNVYVDASAQTTTWFTVRTSSTNISGSSVSIDHPLLNGNSRAKLFVAHVTNLPGLAETLWNHPLITSYNGSRWLIRNVDGTAMPAGLGFNVRIDPGASQYSTRRPELSAPVQFIELDEPSANGNPYATIVVSSTWWLAANAHPVAVQYHAPRWRIMNADRALIPAGVRFNVRVLGFSAYRDGSVDSRLDDFISNAAGVSTKDAVSTQPPAARPLNFWWQLGNNPVFPMLLTQNLSPMGNNVSPDGKYIGLKYLDGIAPRWAVVYEDGSGIPLSSAFNILGRPQPLVP